MKRNLVLAALAGLLLALVPAMVLAGGPAGTSCGGGCIWSAMCAGAGGTVCVVLGSCTPCGGGASIWSAPAQTQSWSQPSSTQRPAWAARIAKNFEQNPSCHWQKTRYWSEPAGMWVEKWESVGCSFHDTHYRPTEVPTWITKTLKGAAAAAAGVILSPPWPAP